MNIEELNDIRQMVKQEVNEILLTHKLIKPEQPEKQPEQEKETEKKKK